jgi:hypothetical protein
VHPTPPTMAPAATASDPAAAASAHEDLKLDRGLQNSTFVSWRLAHGDIRLQDVALPGAVLAVKSDATDFLHVRASVARNHLAHSGGRHFVFLEGACSGAEVHELAVGADGAVRDAPVAGARGRWRSR